MDQKMTLRLMVWGFVVAFGCGVACDIAAPAVLEVRPIWFLVVVQASWTIALIVADIASRHVCQPRVPELELAILTALEAERNYRHHHLHHQDTPDWMADEVRLWCRAVRTKEAVERMVRR